jgi:hypothetical protein
MLHPRDGPGHDAQGRQLSAAAGHLPRLFCADHPGELSLAGGVGVARWGMPSSRKALLDAATRRADKLWAKGKDVDFDELLRMEPDGGTTNTGGCGLPEGEAVV